MTADLQTKAHENAAVLYMAMELSNEIWRLAFGDGTNRCQVSIAAGDMVALSEQIGKAKVKWGLGEEAAVVS